MNAPAIAFDSETHLIKPGAQAPRLVCVSAAARDVPHGALYARKDSEAFLRWLLQPENPQLITGANVAYDLAVASSNWPDLIPWIFEAYARDRVTDIQIREKLLKIARGSHTKATRYNLAALSAAYLKKDRSGQKKGPDVWRLRYAELDGVPLSEWPEAAKEYALEDASDTYAIHELQTQKAEGTDFLDDQFRQARKAWWLQLTQIHGIVTDPWRVQALDRRVRTRYLELRDLLIENELVRVKKTKRRTDGEKGQLKWKAGEITVEYVRKDVDARAMMKKACEAIGIEPKLTETDSVSLDSEACEQLANHGLGLPPFENFCVETAQAFGEYVGLTKYVSTDLPVLWSGTKHPIHARFDSLKETGRTGCSKPNLQNQKRSGGVRECFVPRPGHVFAVCDYDGLELRTMAQVCMSVFKYSALAEALNSGDDPHLRVGAQMLGISYEDAKKRLKAKDPEVKNARQCGKIANFGFPGGLGARSLVAYAWGNYRVRLTEEEARQLKTVWLTTFPEFRRYFEWINAHITNGEKGAFKHLFSNRTRGNIYFTQCCNTPFQGLGGDATGHAGFLIAQACYIDQSSPLYGCRIVNYIHDEFMLEVPDDHRAEAAARELARLMILGANEFLPDVPATATPLLARRWSKDAEPVYNESGALIPWEEEPNEKAA